VLPSQPKRPGLKEATKNFRLPSFETLGFTANEAGRLMSSPFLLQPLTELTTERTPSLSPDHPSPSTIHQYIITRTPPADADPHPTFIQSTDHAELPPTSALTTVVTEPSLAPATLADPESNFDSQWSTDVVPKISEFNQLMDSVHGLG